MTPLGRVLLADDSPHAQRMGERILREEGYEVVTVTDGETAIMRIKDVDPDVLIVDAFLPQVSGYDLCGYIKKQPQHSHVRVLLTSTALEKVDDDQAYKAGADGQLKKPFEASVMLKSLKDLIGGSDKDKKKRAGTTLDLSSSLEETQESAEPESVETPARPEDKPVSALQAWLDQHETEPLDATEETEPEPTASDEPVVNAAGDSSRLANPQLLRNVQDEPEDLSLRNNPVARLRQTPAASESAAADIRVTAVPAARKEDESSEAPGQSVRSLRMPALVPPVQDREDRGDRSEGEGAGPVRVPRKSLLEALEEYERASQIVDDEPEIPEVAIEESAEPEWRKEEDEPVPSMTPLEQEVASAIEAEKQAEAELELETAEPEVDAVVAEEAPGESAEEEPIVIAAEEVAEAPEEPATAPEIAAHEPEPVPEASPVMAAVAERTVVSLAEGGVHLDEEEVRAAVEIAVSAAMPSIVDEVSRCVYLALESRFAVLAGKNGDRSHD